MVYETFDADGQVLRTGRVLAAEMQSAGKTWQALWFQPPGGKGGYYRPNGDSLRKAYLSSPVEFTRVSSGFAMRMHPILNSWRQHNGIDFAAPTGTPVRTVGDGKVDFAGQQNGYGNIVIIGHRNGQQTAYAHLSHQRQGRRAGRAGPDHRRRRLDRLGHRAAPALRVPHQRRVPRPEHHRPAERGQRRDHRRPAAGLRQAGERLPHRAGRGLLGGAGQRGLTLA